MNHFISLEEAIALTSHYRNRKEQILEESQRGKNILAQSETFDRAAFDQVLAQPGCTALRIYYGMKENDQVHAVIVGVNASGQDMLPQAGAALNDNGNEEDEIHIIEIGQRCPDLCPEESPLNNP